MAKKYSRGAQKSVKQAMHEKKEGTLRSGSGRKVTSRKQAIAIGLSQARKKGAKVPKKTEAKKRSGRPAKKRIGRPAKKRTSSTPARKMRKQ